MKSTLAERLALAMAGPPKVTGRALATACDISPASVSGWVTGDSKSIDGRNLLAAAKHLRVRPEWLATGDGPMRAEDTLENGAQRMEDSTTRSQALLTVVQTKDDLPALAWPFSEALHARILKSKPAEILRCENAVRLVLNMDLLPPPANAESIHATP